mmetsp:Transcript_21812/g.41086  ORF Transcript_21812/g.41086 Transcript_21812/m.41086 type:complete len:211 (-) Transcript_21812:1122-1754(-)
MHAMKPMAKRYRRGKPAEYVSVTKTVVSICAYFALMSNSGLVYNVMSSEWCLTLPLQHLRLTHVTKIFATVTMGGTTILRTMLVMMVAPTAAYHARVRSSKGPSNRSGPRTGIWLTKSRRPFGPYVFTMNRTKPVFRVCATKIFCIMEWFKAVSDKGLSNRAMEMMTSCRTKLMPTTTHEAAVMMPIPRAVSRNHGEHVSTKDVSSISFA